MFVQGEVGARQQREMEEKQARQQRAMEEMQARQQRAMEEMQAQVQLLLRGNAFGGESTSNQQL